MGASVIREDRLPDAMSGIALHPGCEPVRHCERSEAIQKCVRGDGLDCFAALAMTAGRDESAYAFSSTVLNSAGKITSKSSTSSE